MFDSTEILKRTLFVLKGQPTPPSSYACCFYFLTFLTPSPFSGTINDQSSSQCFFCVVPTIKPIFENIIFWPKGGSGQFLGAFLDGENF
jgi:hypothetical protein